MAEYSKQKVGIIAECVSDLPKKFLCEHHVEVLYFLIETDSGVFTDTNEITSENIIGYMEAGGKKSFSAPPPPEVYREVFERGLRRYDEVLLITISSGISESYAHAKSAVEQMGDYDGRVHIFDSMHLSTGLGHIVVKAVELAESGLRADKIIAQLTEYRQRVSTTFLTVNADYLYRSGKVSQKVKKLCDMFNVHPVLVMRDGVIKLKYVLFGEYENAYLRYVAKELRRSSSIDKKLIFITHVGCGIKMIERIKQEVNKRCPSEELIVTNASATISSNCGPRTFGVLFVNDKA